MQSKIRKLIISAVLFFLNHSLYAANSSSSVLFSPYVDLTLNTYWDSQYQDMEPMDLIEISRSTGIRDYHLAFITDAGSCNPAWGGQANLAVSTAFGQHLTDKMRANLIGYTISFGGANNSDISFSCSESQLINTFTQIINLYQPNGLDFDIENGSANVAKLMKALKQIQNTHPEIKLSFTLPVLPEGLVASGQEIIRLAKDYNLHYAVNIMAMDYGSAYVNDMGQYAIQAATNLFTFLQKIYPEKSDTVLWQMVEVTPMIGVNDVNVEQFTLTNVDTLRNFAKQNHLGLLSMWSIARDKPCAGQWASPICSGGNLQTVPYEFSQRFLR